MPAYHSSQNELENVRVIGNTALLPFKTQVRGPSLPPADPQAPDVIDETLDLFRANCFFRNFEIKGSADRVLIYLTLFIQECLGKLQKLPSLIDAQKSLLTLAVQNFALPGDPSFPLNAVYEKPVSKTDADTLKAYLTQLRQECASRLIQRIYVDDKPSKWWMCFSKRKFMGLSGVGTSNL